MNLFLIFLSLPIIAAATENTKIPIYNSGGEKLYCVQRQQLANPEYIERSSSFGIFTGHSPGQKGTITCYQCCVGESPNTSDTCKNLKYNNWAKGKNCGCK